MPAPDAFISHGLGRTLGVPAALVALLAYSELQIGLYGALGPAAATLAATYLHVHAQWWVWALAAWAIITILGLLNPLLYRLHGTRDGVLDVTAGDNTDGGVPGYSAGRGYDLPSGIGTVGSAPAFVTALARLASRQ